MKKFHCKIIFEDDKVGFSSSQVRTRETEGETTRYGNLPRELPHLWKSQRANERVVHSWNLKYLFLYERRTSAHLSLVGLFKKLTVHKNSNEI